MGVYAALTALDFPFCYLFVRWMGTDRIGEWIHCLIWGECGVQSLGEDLVGVMGYGFNKLADGS